MQTSGKNLHSTMYLLNPNNRVIVLCKQNNLHSTMYLLNLRKAVITFTIHIFTFHYVSIKSDYEGTYSKFKMYLHSTMYLLNR